MGGWLFIGLEMLSLECQVLADHVECAGSEVGLSVGINPQMIKESEWLDCGQTETAVLESDQGSSQLQLQPTTNICPRSPVNRSKYQQHQFVSQLCERKGRDCLTCRLFTLILSSCEQPISSLRNWSWSLSSLCFIDVVFE